MPPDILTLSPKKALIETNNHIKTLSDLKLDEIFKSSMFTQNLSTQLKNDTSLLKKVDIGKMDAIAVAINDILQNVLVDRGAQVVDITQTGEYIYSQHKKKINDKLGEKLGEKTGLSGNSLSNIQGILHEHIKKAIATTLLESGRLITPSSAISGSNPSEGKYHITPEIGQRIHEFKQHAPTGTSLRTFYKLCKATETLTQEQVTRFLNLVKDVEPANTDFRQKKSEKDIVSHVEQGLLELMTHYAADSVKRLEISTKIVQIWKEVLSSKEIQSFHLFNIPYINQTLIKGLSKGQVNIDILTCPDYSGESDESGVFNFDFKGIGSGTDGELSVGVVTEKAFDVVQTWYKAIAKHVQVKVNHSLPTWEFPPEGMPNAGLSKVETTNILKQQTALIKLRYKSLGIPADVHLSSDSVLEDEEFWSQVEKTANNLKEESKQDPKLAELIKNTFTKRYSLYAKWYPILEGETQEIYSQRLMDTVVVKSLAEYLVAGKTLTDRDSLVIDTSSTITNAIYAHYKIPVFHGRSSKATNYAGA